MPRPFRVSLLGAESTGKTQLAQQLAAHWTAGGHSVASVPEVLREWCEREGCVPRREQQQGIAREQARRADEAPAADWLVADTAPLMVAIYSELLFDDRTLHAFALEHQRKYDLTLLTGLDIPWVADGLQRDGPHVREPVDAALRAALESAALRYSVVYGSGAQRLKNALAAIESVAAEQGLTRYTADFPSESGRLAAACADCDDPLAQRRLFTARSP